MTKSFRILLTCGLAFMLLSAAACTGHHDGCRPNPVATDEMAELDLPAPKSGKLCLAQTRLVTYEIQKDQSEVQPEFRERLEKAGWKETYRLVGIAECVFRKKRQTGQVHSREVSRIFPYRSL
jgi:hypothetical protein